jgi:hypothetical protein
MKDISVKDISFSHRVYPKRKPIFCRRCPDWKRVFIGFEYPKGDLKK